MTERFRVEITPAADPFSAHARKVEGDVFLEAFGNTSETIKEEYDPYEHLSTFVHVFDTQEQRSAGAARILLGKADELKSVRDVTNPPWNAKFEDLVEAAGLEGKTALDVATLAVSPAYRGAQLSNAVSMAIYKGVLLYGKTIGVDPMVAVFDTKVLALINRIFKNAWHYYPGVEPAEYLGSPLSAPAWCLNSDLEARIKENAPSVHTMIYGPTLEGFQMPNWSDFKKFDL